MVYYAYARKVWICCNIQAKLLLDITPRLIYNIQKVYSSVVTSLPSESNQTNSAVMNCVFLYRLLLLLCLIFAGTVVGFQRDETSSREVAKKRLDALQRERDRDRLLQDKVCTDDANRKQQKSSCV